MVLHASVLATTHNQSDASNRLTSMKLNCAHYLAIFSGLLLQTVQASPLRACYGNWQPYIYKNEQNELVGIAKELLSSAVEEIGRTIEYVRLPYKRCISEVKAGRLDIAMFTSPAKTDLIESRTTFAYWTPAVVVRKQDRLTQFHSLNQLLDRMVIVVDGYDYPGALGGWLSDHPTVARVSYGGQHTYGYTLLFRMLEAGRGDVFIEDLYWSRHLIQEQELDLRVLEPAVTCEANNIGYREGLNTLRDQIDHALLVRGDTYRDALFAKYTGQPESAFTFTYSQASETKTKRPCRGLEPGY